MAKEKKFTLEGVQGELTLVYGPFKLRLFQDGREIKRSGTFKPKYYITNTSGEQEELRIQYGLDFVYMAIFRGQKIALDERLTTAEYIIGGLPILLIFLGGAMEACSVSLVPHLIMIICGKKNVCRCRYWSHSGLPSYVTWPTSSWLSLFNFC